MSARNCSGSPLLHAEALDERVVDFRQHRLGHLGRPSGAPATCLAGELRHAPVGRELDRRRPSPRPWSCRPAPFSISGNMRARTDARWRPSRRLRPAGARRRPATRSRSSTASPCCGGALDRRSRCGAAGAGFRSSRRCRRRRLRRCGARLELGDVDVAEVRHDFEGGDVRQLAVAPGRLGSIRGLPASAARSRGRLVEALAQQAVERPRCGPAAP